MRQAYYTSKAERAELLSESTANNEIMLHDDFVDENDENIENPDGTTGRLTFEAATAGLTRTATIDLFLKFEFFILFNVIILNLPKH